MEISKEHLETIQTVVALHSPKYRVPGYEPEDIAQEAFIIALECYKDYNPEVGPFENFLSKHLSFRLKTFVRDMTLNESIYKDNKKKLMCPLDISLVGPEYQNALVDKSNLFEDIEIQEILQKVDSFIPVSMRKTLLQIRAGVKVNRGRAKKIRQFLLTIFKEVTGEFTELDNEED